MAEVPDHLVPQDGLTNSSVRWYGMEIMHGQGTVRFFFGIYDDNQQKIADFPIDLPVTGDRPGVTPLIAEAHRRMNDILRQWLYMNDAMFQSYSTTKE
jgi:hypothetical protein